MPKLTETLTILLLLLTASAAMSQPTIAREAVWFDAVQGQQNVDGAETVTTYEWMVVRDGHGTVRMNGAAHRFRLSSDDLNRLATLLMFVRTTPNNPPQGICPIMNSTIDTVEWSSPDLGSTDIDHCWGRQRFTILNQAINILRAAAGLPILHGEQWDG